VDFCNEKGAQYGVDFMMIIITIKIIIVELIFHEATSFMGLCMDCYIILYLGRQYKIVLLCRWFRFAQLAKGKKFRP
jgi:hypothetical protein